MNEILKAEFIYKSFFKNSEEVPVLRGVDLTLKEGEMVAITGASGVGKSTLLHILGTLELPTSGKVYFGPSKEDIFGYSEKDLAKFRNEILGFVFQFHYLLPEFSALENVMMPALIAGWSSQKASEKAQELLAFVGLEHRMVHCPAELSGGEQQRVAIARSVVLQPKLLLADELTGNLDSANRALVMDLLVKLNEKLGVSILLITHDLKLTEKTHRTLLMKDGVFVS
jgi:lipoprotein-releasing system ATP-binding protein